MNKKFTVRIRSFLMIALYAFMVGCIEQYDPNISGLEQESVLVVEGFISTENVPQKIKLSRSKSVNQTSVYIKEEGATVEIMDMENKVYPLTEAGNGEYSIDPSEMTPQAGQSYQLRIKLENGEQYESDFQKLQAVAPIDSLWYDHAIVSTTDGQYSSEMDMFNLYTNYEDGTDSKYYRYEYSGIYGVQAPYQGSTICWGEDEEPPKDIPTALVCYLPESVRLPLNVSTYPDPLSEIANGAKIVSFPVDSRFIIGYSMVVKKTAITEGYYNFLSEVKDQQDNGGSIFDPPPTEIVGNIRNVEHPEKYALGYFSAVSAIEKRIFISGLSFVDNGVLCYYDPSAPPPANRPKYKTCCDCRLNPNAMTEPPENWGN